MVGDDQDGLDVEGGVPYHAPVPQALPADLELGLDHEQQVGVGGGGPQQGAQDQGQGDKGQVPHHQGGGGGHRGRVEGAHVGPVQLGDPRVTLEGPGQLPVAHVHGGHVGGPTAQEHVGKAPRGGPRVQAAPPAHGGRQATGAQGVQGPGELVGAAGDVPVVGDADLQGLGGVDLSGGLGDHDAVEGDVPVGDHLGGLGT